jgi:hypothetical protein
MTMLGSSGTDDLLLDVLWEDGERVFCRTWRVDANMQHGKLGPNLADLCRLWFARRSCGYA